MDNIEILKDWLEDVKKDIKEFGCGLLEIQILDNKSENIKLYGDISSDECLFIVEDEDLFIFNKKELKTIIDVVNGFEVFNRFTVDVNGEYLVF